MIEWDEDNNLMCNGKFYGSILFDENNVMGWCPRFICGSFEPSDHTLEVMKEIVRKMEEVQKQ